MRISDWSSDVCSSDLHCALIYSRFRPGFDVPIFHPSLPETRDRTRQDVAFNLTQCRTPFRFALLKAGYYISAQDNRMTGPQSSRYAYPDNRRDLHSRHDAAGQRYRIIMQELAARPTSDEHTSELQSIMRISYAVLCSKHKKIK